MERAYRHDPVMSDDYGHRTLTRMRARRNTNRIDIFQLGLRGIDSRKPVKAAAIGVHQNGPVRHDARFEWHPVPRWLDLSARQQRLWSQNGMKQFKIGEAPDLHHVGAVGFHHDSAGGDEPVELRQRRHRVRADRQFVGGHGSARCPNYVTPGVELGDATVVAGQVFIARRWARTFAAKITDEHVTVWKTWDVVRVAIGRRWRDCLHDARMER